MFKIEGKEIIPNKFNPQAILKYVEKIPFGNFITTKTLIKEFGYSDGGKFREQLKSLLKNNIVYYGNKMIIGSRKTVAAFKKEVEKCTK